MAKGVRDYAIDAGNGDIKIFDGQGFTHFRHALAQLNESDWRRVTNQGRQDPPVGYIKVNGVPYAYGDQARRYQIRERPAGAQRYTKEYYGVLMCAALSFKATTNERINLYATHAPADFDYAEDLKAAARGTWEVHNQSGMLRYAINAVETVDEPMAGVYHYALTPQYTERKNNRLGSASFLTIDVGAYTADVVVFDAGYDLDLGSLKSTRIGMRNVLENFEAELRGKYRTTFKTALDLDPRRVEKALLEGVYRAGREALDCIDIARAQMLSLTNDVVDIVNANGGWQNYDALAITGGGGGLLMPYLQEAFPHIDILPVEPVSDRMRYANAIGAFKFFRLMERLNG